MHYQIQLTTPKHLTTAHLAQTMSLLKLTWDEVRQKIENELSTNPALELMEEIHCPNCHSKISNKGFCPICSRPGEIGNDQPIVYISSRMDFQSEGSYQKDTDFSSEDWLTSPEDLPAYVLRQIAPELDPQDRHLAAHLLTCLNEDGLLDTPLVEIAQYNHVPLSRIDKVLSFIQHSDPLGVGSPTPQKALLVQLEVLEESQPVPGQTALIIKEGMEMLSRKAYNELSRKFNISLTQVKEIAAFISDNLNPFPARANWGEYNSKASTQVYIHPDILVSCLNDRPDTPLIVEILSPYAGGLRINPLFKDAISEAPSEKIEQWQSAIDTASLFVKCLQQRDQALVRMMQSLVIHQRDFFLNGDAELIPTTRAEIADELGVHESTISRAVSDKTIQLPNRHIIPLSKLFDRSLHIRTALRQIIDEENMPLSDTEITLLLKEKGYSVARRTVAKYRAMEGILPARFRECVSSVQHAG